MKTQTIQQILISKTVQKLSDDLNLHKQLKSPQSIINTCVSAIEAAEQGNLEIWGDQSLLEEKVSSYVERGDTIIFNDDIVYEPDHRFGYNIHRLTL